MFYFSNIINSSCKAIRSFFKERYFLFKCFNSRRNVGVVTIL